MIEKIKQLIKNPGFREWLDAAKVAFILFLIIRTFVVQAFKIPTGSMIPTLKVGDMLLVSKFWYGPKIPFTDIRLPGLSKPKRGDVIVFLYPVDKKRDFIKRLIGLGGETIEIKEVPEEMGNAGAMGINSNNDIFVAHFGVLLHDKLFRFAKSTDNGTNWVDISHHIVTDAYNNTKETKIISNI